MGLCVKEPAFEEFDAVTKSPIHSSAIKNEAILKGHGNRPTTVQIH